MNARRHLKPLEASSKYCCKFLCAQTNNTVDILRSTLNRTIVGCVDEASLSVQTLIDTQKRVTMWGTKDIPVA
jgi:hypothetical protein